MKRTTIPSHSFISGSTGGVNTRQSTSVGSRVDREDNPARPAARRIVAPPIMRRSRGRRGRGKQLQRDSVIGATSGAMVGAVISAHLTIYRAALVAPVTKRYRLGGTRCEQSVCESEILRAALGCGEGSFVARSERSMPSTKLSRILATSVFLLGLAGCGGSQKACQIVQPVCSSNCQPVVTPSFSTPPAPTTFWLSPLINPREL